MITPEHISEQPKIRFFNNDNMLVLSQMPDNYYDLAIIDPPYGLNIHKMGFTNSLNGGVAKRRDYSNTGDWDSAAPTKEFFDEMFRVSKNQIIFGGNYFTSILQPTKSWIVWDKRTDDKYNNDFADGELAWTSFDKPLRIYRYLWSGMLQGNMKHKQERIHPTEKPVSLYRWILMKYANKGDKILDTHGGSMSIAIACDIEGFDLDIIEADNEMFTKALKRFKQHKQVLRLF